MKIKIRKVGFNYIEVPFLDFASRVYLANIAMQVIIGVILFAIIYLVGLLL